MGSECYLRLRTLGKNEIAYVCSVLGVRRKGKVDFSVDMLNLKCVEEIQVEMINKQHIWLWKSTIQ